MNSQAQIPNPAPCGLLLNSKSVRSTVRNAGVNCRRFDLKMIVMVLEIDEFRIRMHRAAEL